MLDVVYFDAEEALAQDTEIEIPYTAVSGADCYRAFAWNSLDGLVPLCEAPTYPEA